MESKLISPEEVAERLNVPAWNVRQWLRTGYLPGLKLGKLWRVSEKDLAKFIEARRNTANS